MDDFLQFIHWLFCGDGQTQAADTVLLTLFLGAGAAEVSCVDPDERIKAAYPRFILSGDEGEQAQSGDAQARDFTGSVRLEIVTRQSAAVPDELELLDNLKARATELLLGSPDETVLPMQGRVFTVSGRRYNVAVFQQMRPTERLPAEDPTIKRWGGTYRVLLHRLAA